MKWHAFDASAWVVLCTNKFLIFHLFCVLTDDLADGKFALIQNEFSSTVYQFIVALVVVLGALESLWGSETFGTVSFSEQNQVLGVGRHPGCDVWVNICEWWQWENHTVVFVRWQRDSLIYLLRTRSQPTTGTSLRAMYSLDDRVWRCRSLCERTKVRLL